MDEHLMPQSMGWWCQHSAQVTLFCCTLLLGSEAPPPSRLVSLPARGRPRVQEHFLLHSFLPAAGLPQFLYFSLSFCPTQLRGGFVALFRKSVVFYQCSIDVLCESFYLQMWGAGFKDFLMWTIFLKFLLNLLKYESALCFVFFWP